MVNKVILAGIFILAILLILGCSVTSLHCGDDGDSSFVKLTSTSETLNKEAPNLTKLCAFAYEVKMRRRHKLSRKKSRQNFSRNSGTHRKNFRTGMARGGYRL